MELDVAFNGIYMAITRSMWLLRGFVWHLLEGCHVHTVSNIQEIAMSHPNLRKFCISHIVDIGRYQLSISTFGIFLLARLLPVRPHPALRSMHACNAVALSISQRTASTAWISDISLHRRPILYLSLVLHRISLFNSAGLLMHRTADAEVTLPTHPGSKISISIADIDRYRLYAIASIALRGFNGDCFTRRCDRSIRNMP